MAIDPRISMGVRAPDVGSALNMFNNIMQQGKLNERADKQQAMNLLQSQQGLLAGEQTLARNKINLQNEEDRRDLRSLAEFTTLNDASIQQAVNGDTLPLQQALAARVRDFPAQGRDPSQSLEALQMIQNGDVAGAISGLKGAQQLAQQSGLIGGNRVTDSQLKQERITKGLEGAIDENGKLKPRESLTYNQEMAAIEAKLIPAAVGSASQTIARQGNLSDVANVESELSGARESGKLKSQTQELPKIKRLVKSAEIAAIKRGEVFNDLNRAKAAMPGLEQVVGKLKELAPLVTSTFGGAVYDAAAKQLGFGSTKGATAKAKFTAMIENQVLPLLRDTFGAAFTAAEGERLRDAMGDPDASPDQKLAQLNSFIEQKYRDIETKESELSGLDGGIAAPTTNPESQIDYSTMSLDDLLGDF